MSCLMWYILKYKKILYLNQIESEKNYEKIIIRIK